MTTNFPNATTVTVVTKFTSFPVAAVVATATTVTFLILLYNCPFPSLGVVLKARRSVYVNIRSFYPTNIAVQLLSVSS